MLNAQFPDNEYWQLGTHWGQIFYLLARLQHVIQDIIYDFLHKLFYKKGVKIILDFIKEDPVGVVFLLFIFGLLYIYKTRGFTKRGFYSKPSNLYFWSQVGLLVLLFIWQPWKE